MASKPTERHKTHKMEIYPLKEMCNSYFCVTSKNQMHHECALLFYKQLKKYQLKAFHWLELVTEILSFLQIISIKTISFCNILETLPEYQQKNYISGIFWAFKSKLQIIHVATYFALFLPGSNNCFFICLVSERKNIIIISQRNLMTLTLVLTPTGRF